VHHDLRGGNAPRAGEAREADERRFDFVGFDFGGFEFREAGFGRIGRYRKLWFRSSDGGRSFRFRGFGS
jgi:hypothetical protein